jgi:hypothetical protein
MTDDKDKKEDKKEPKSQYKDNDSTGRTIEETYHGDEEDD